MTSVLLSFSQTQLIMPPFPFFFCLNILKIVMPHRSVAQDAVLFIQQEDNLPLFPFSCVQGIGRPVIQSWVTVLSLCSSTVGRGRSVDHNMTSEHCQGFFWGGGLPYIFHSIFDIRIYFLFSDLHDNPQSYVSKCDH